MKKTIFAGELRKDNIRYYFEIATKEAFCDAPEGSMPEPMAYIEKTTLQNKSLGDGYFTVEQARKCYKALLDKGFKAYFE